MSELTKSIPAGTIQELKEKGYLTVTSQGHDIVILYNDDKIYALDNRSMLLITDVRIWDSHSTGEAPKMGY
jgi:hypothetical protein